MKDGPSEREPYKAVARRVGGEGGTWLVTESGGSDIIVTTKRLDQVVPLVARHRAGQIGKTPSGVRVELTVTTPFDEQINASKELGDATEKMAIAHATASRNAVQSLLSHSYSTRDIAHLLGISPSRVSQLKADADLDAAPQARRKNLVDAVKLLLTQDKDSIELAELLNSHIRQTAFELTDPSIFPVDHVGGKARQMRQVVDVVELYDEYIAPLAGAAAVLGAYGDTSRHAQLATKLVSTISRCRMTNRLSSNLLMPLRRYPVLPVLYAGAVAAVSTKNAAMLKAIVADPRTRNEYLEDLSVLDDNGLWAPFSAQEEGAQAIWFNAATGDMSEEAALKIAHGARTDADMPTSYYLHSKVRTYLENLVVDDHEYDTAFDRTEVLIGLIATDEDLTMHERVGNTNDRLYIANQWIGRFTKEVQGYGTKTTLEHTQQELDDQGEKWWPLQAGMFGGSVKRARAATEAYLPLVKEISTLRASRR